MFVITYNSTIVFIVIVVYILRKHHVRYIHVLMRDEKERRKKQARSSKHTRQSNTVHPRQSLFLRKMSCLGSDSNPRHSTLLASVPGLPRSVRVFYVCRLRTIKTRTERGRPGTEATILLPRQLSWLGMYSYVRIILLYNYYTLYSIPWPMNGN